MANPAPAVRSRSEYRNAPPKQRRTASDSTAQTAAEALVQSGTAIMTTIGNPAQIRFMRVRSIAGGFWQTGQTLLRAVSRGATPQQLVRGDAAHRLLPATPSSTAGTRRRRERF